MMDCCEDEAFPSDKREANTIYEVNKLHPCADRQFCLNSSVSAPWSSKNLHCNKTSSDDSTVAPELKQEYSKTTSSTTTIIQPIAPSLSSSSISSLLSILPVVHPPFSEQANLNVFQTLTSELDVDHENLVKTSQLKPTRYISSLPSDRSVSPSTVLSCHKSGNISWNINNGLVNNSKQMPDSRLSLRYQEREFPFTNDRPLQSESNNSNFSMYTSLPFHLMQQTATPKSPDTTNPSSIDEGNVIPYFNPFVHTNFSRNTSRSTYPIDTIMPSVPGCGTYHTSGLMCYSEPRQHHAVDSGCYHDPNTVSPATPVDSQQQRQHRFQLNQNSSISSIENSDITTAIGVNRDMDYQRGPYCENGSNQQHLGNPEIIPVSTHSRVGQSADVSVKNDSNANDANNTNNIILPMIPASQFIQNNRYYVNNVEINNKFVDGSRMLSYSVPQQPPHPSNIFHPSLFGIPPTHNSIHTPSSSYFGQSPFYQSSMDAAISGLPIITSFDPAYHYSTNNLLNSIGNGYVGDPIINRRTCFGGYGEHPIDPSSRQRQLKHAGKRSPTTHKARRERTTFSKEQLAKLEEAYTKVQYPDTIERTKIGQSIKIDETRVQVWFKNRRAKSRQMKLRRDKQEQDDMTMKCMSSANCSNQQYHNHGSSVTGGHNHHNHYAHHLVPLSNSCHRSSVVAGQVYATPSSQMVQPEMAPPVSDERELRGPVMMRLEHHQADEFYMEHRCHQT